MAFFSQKHEKRNWKSKTNDEAQLKVIKKRWLAEKPLWTLTDVNLTNYDKQNKINDEKKVKSYSILSLKFLII